MNDAEVIPVSDVLTARGFMNRHTSIFDQTFEDVVKAFQKTAGFTGKDIDGKVGPKTVKAMGGTWTGK